MIGSPLIEQSIEGLLFVSNIAMLQIRIFMERKVRVPVRATEPRLQHIAGGNPAEQELATHL